MALGDIQIMAESNGHGYPGDMPFAVAASATLINACEPVVKALGNSTGNVVAPMATNKPVVGTDYLAGLSATTSTNTASSAGAVNVMPINTTVTLYMAPNNPTLWATQSLYNALVGARVLMDLTSGRYTLLATDGATNGCVVEPIDLLKYPGRVAFKFRGGLNYAA